MKRVATMKKQITTICIGALFWGAAIGCSQHQVEVAPVEVKPIHITIDVNIRMQKALDDFFDEIDAAEEEMDAQAAQDTAETDSNTTTP